MNVKLKAFGAIITMCVLAFPAKALLNAPELVCASVLPSGDVEVSWISPLDPTGSFVQYEIFRSAAIGGPYVTVGVVANYLQNTFTDVGAAAGASQQFYFINVLDNGAAPNLSSDSDTLSTLFLTVAQSAPLGSAMLNWNTQHVPAVPSSLQEYVVWMEFPAGTWSIIDTTVYTVLNYQHVVSACNAFLSFRVSIESSTGCTSFSNVAGDQFEDETAPSIPEVITASVDTATGLANFKWSASPEADTDGYIIVNVISTGSVIIDTVFGQFNTTYTDPSGNPVAGSLTYTIAAFDTCFSGSPPQPNTSATVSGQSTIHLFGNYGEYVPQGVYAYFFSYSTGSGKRVEKKGTVTFIDLRE